ncbi:MAG: DNA helicase RecQ, partial [Lactobacillus sp.]|nr:DNA helicase RecQ [Lactobacillus sp.]
SDADQKYKELQYQKFQAITDYVNTGECLQQFIVRYFGQDCPPCGKCSNCLNQGDLKDITTDAQKVIALVYELDGRFGKNVVAQCLVGSTNQRMQEMHAEQYEHFNSLKVSQKEAVSLIDYLIASGYLKIEGTKYPLLHVTNRGWDVLDGKAIVKRRISKIQKKKQIFDEDENVSLFDALREKRKELAKKQRVPAFMIFSDRSLHDMAKIKPQNENDFLEVSGVGQAKLKKYGHTMLNVIRQFIN